MKRSIVLGMFLMVIATIVRAQSITVEPDTLRFRGDTVEVKSFLLTFTNMGGSSVWLRPPPGFYVSSYIPSDGIWPSSLALVGYNDYSRLMYVKCTPGAAWNRLPITCPIDTVYVNLCGLNPVPVQLMSLRGSYNRTSNAVDLAWRTLSETNNYGFVVQRKSTGESGFSDLLDGFVPGHGTTLEPHEYSFTDTHASPGRLFYRLKQIDLDNAVHFTEPIVTEVLTNVDGHSHIAGEPNLLQNYPNPFNPTTTISYQLLTTSHVMLRVFDLLGREVVSLVSEVQDAGFKSVKLDATNLAGGVYIYHLQAGGYTATRRLQILR